MSLINKIHHMYINDKVTIDLLKTLDVAMADVEKKVNDIERQRLLNFASWYVENIERELGISEAVGERTLSNTNCIEISDNTDINSSDFKNRCERVRLKLLTRGKVSLDGVREIVDKYFSWNSVNYGAEKMTITILLRADENPKSLELMKGELREYVPAHILLVYGNYGRSHQELKAYTHRYLSGYTHKEIRENTEL